METTTTTQSIELFITALVGQNYSPKTLRAYRDDLKQFMQWVGENRVDWDNPRRFTRADVEGFMSYLAGQNMTGKATLAAGLVRITTDPGVRARFSPTAQ
jgi:site-specific recombinase XerD